MALRKISSWRPSAERIVWGLFSHILLEPSMSVNRKVTVPVGGATIRYAASFSFGGTIAPASLLQKRFAKRSWTSLQASQHAPASPSLVSTSACQLLVHSLYGSLRARRGP